MCYEKINYTYTLYTFSINYFIIIYINYNLIDTSESNPCEDGIHLSFLMFYTMVVLINRIRLQRLNLR